MAHGCLLVAEWEPSYVRGAMFRPVIGTAASRLLRAHLKSGQDLYLTGKKVVEFQLKSSAESLQKIQALPQNNELFGIDFSQIRFKGKLGDNPEDDVSAI